MARTLIAAMIGILVVALGCGGGGGVVGGGGAGGSAGGGDGGTGAVGGQAAGPSLFVEGCPVKGKASARKISNPDLRVEGPDALAADGDFLLMNANAAFVIQGSGHVNTYYYYGGVPIDAVALNGCSQASRERFEELWLLLGKLNASAFAGSILRAFRGDSFDIVNDGADGKAAIVKVTGADDVFWLAEDELIDMSYQGGVPKQMSEPFGVKVEVAYILPPDSNVLQLDITFRNQSADWKSFLAAAAARFGDSTEARWYVGDTMSISGFDIAQAVPWMVAAGGDGAWAFAMKSGLMGTLDVAGVTALVDLNQLFGPIVLNPAGQEDDAATITYYLSVGGFDSNSAVRPLHEVNPEPIPGAAYSLTPVQGSVTGEDGAAVVGALVEVQGKNGKGQWSILDSFYTGADGSFGGEVANFGGKIPLRLQARALGRPDPAPIDLPLPAPPVTITMGASGTLAYDIKDDEGRALPAKILLWQQGTVARRIYGTGAGTVTLVPGDYEVSVTRGFEYGTFQGQLTVTAGAEAALAVTLGHLIDTTGWVSTDAHEHAGPSPDNKISIPDRIRSAAAEGVDVAVSTDHEYVSSWQWAIDETGLGDWIATVVGQEVTAPLPEHTNIYGGVVPRFDLDARGGMVAWFGKDLAEIYALERTRGAQINQLNHPRHYIELIGYDPTTGKLGLTDPTVLGFEEGAALWDWDFDAIELQNGPAEVFGNGGPAMFDYWMSFHNLGHRVTAMGNSDAHDDEIVGTPRDFYPASSEDPWQFQEDELVQAVKEGRVVVSTGAFAKVTINGAGIGDTVTDTDGAADLAVHIEAIPEIEVTHFKVYANCDAVLTVATSDPAAVVKYDGVVKVPAAKDVHVVVVGFGKSPLPRGMSQFNERVPRFVTNPIFVDRDGNGVFDPPGGKTCAYDMNGP